MKKQNTPPQNWPAVKPNTPPPAGNDLPQQLYFNEEENTVSKWRVYNTRDGANVVWIDPDEETPQGTEIISEIVRRYNDFPALQEQNEKVKRLLHDLTPGGSEFYNDPEYCAKWIRESREENHYALGNMIKGLKEQNKELLEALKLLHKGANLCDMAFTPANISAGMLITKYSK